MKKVALLLLVAACLGAGGVQAETPSPESKPVAADRRCDPVTGSRIARAPDAKGLCDTTDGRLRSFSREDLESTGQIDLAEALTRLDPRLTLQR